MNKLVILLLFNLCVGVQSHAQYRKVIHQTFEIDSIDQVILDLVGDLQIDTWPGNIIMTETTINIFDASSGLIDHMMKAGRYESISERPNESMILTISSKDKDRKSIKVRRRVNGKLVERTVYELVDVRIFIPEDFAFMNEEHTHWERKPEIEDELNTPPAALKKDTTAKGSSPDN